MLPCESMTVIWVGSLSKYNGMFASMLATTVRSPKERLQLDKCRSWRSYVRLASPALTKMAPDSAIFQLISDKQRAVGAEIWFQLMIMRLNSDGVANGDEISLAELFYRFARGVEV